MRKSTLFLAAILAAGLITGVSARNIGVSPADTNPDGSIVQDGTTTTVDASALATVANKAYWDSFDLGTDETVIFNNNTAGVVNYIQSNKMSSLNGTIKSYTDTATTVGGNVALINSKGFNVSKTFSFTGDQLTLGLSDTDVAFTFASPAGTFELESGNMIIDIVGNITGVASFDTTGSLTFDGANILLGNVSVNGNLTADADGSLTMGLVSVENGTADFDADLCITAGNMEFTKVTAASIDAKITATLGNVEFSNPDVAASTLTIKANNVVAGNITVADNNTGAIEAFTLTAGKISDTVNLDDVQIKVVLSNLVAVDLSDILGEDFVSKYIPTFTNVYTTNVQEIVQNALNNSKIDVQEIVKNALSKANVSDTVKTVDVSSIVKNAINNDAIFETISKYLPSFDDEE